MKQLRGYATFAASIAGAVLIAADPALAGTPTPGPVLGAGLPALGAIAGGYFLIRRYRSR